MQRLKGSDAQTLYNDTPTSPYVTLKVMVYEPTKPGKAPTFDEMKAFITNGISGWVEKGLGCRIIRVPWDINHPIWFRDRNFNIDDHIHHIALPEPGDRQKFCDFISYIMSMPLDPNRPLWDSWLVEGLEGGRIAWFCKMHHVLADGLMSAEEIVKIHRCPEGADCDDVEHVVKPAISMPNKVQLVATGLADLARTFALELPKALAKMRQARREQRGMDVEKINAYGPFMAPFTFINKPGGPYRTYRYESFSLSEFKRLSRQFDCTINDLVLTLCSEALRRYYLEFDRIPGSPLVVAMPVANRGDDDDENFLNTEIQNNNVSVAYVPLDLSIADFRKRLASIKAGSRAAMEYVRKTHGTRMENFADFLPAGFFHLFNWLMNLRQRQQKNPLANLAVSNVPGPRETLYACSGRLKMVELLSCGNLIDIGAIGVTVWSYVDNLCFSTFFRKGTVPHPERFTRHLQEVYRELTENFKGPVAVDAEEQPKAGRAS